MKVVMMVIEAPLEGMIGPIAVSLVVEVVVVVWTTVVAGAGRILELSLLG